MRNLTNNFKEAVKRFSKGFEELVNSDTSSAVHSDIKSLEAQGKKAPIPATPGKEEKSTVSSFDRWLSKKNAEYFRNNCYLYTSSLFQKPGDYDLAFRKALSQFWYTGSSVRVGREFPEIHVEFLTVNVYRLRDTWNRRDIDLKQPLLMELRHGLVEFAHSRRFPFEGLFDCLVTDVWKLGDMLVIEIPCSSFPFKHPGLIPALAPEEYWQLKRKLAARSEL